MTFLHPILAAAGIAAISIPIIIHFLMRRRRKPVMWGAMRFLLEAYKEHRRRLKLEQFLLLLARCLVIALIGIGLARPMLGGGSVLGGRAPLELYLLIDNSLTSSATGPDGNAALERHKAEALRLLDELDSAAGDRAGLIALGGPAQPLVAPASADVGALRGLISGLTPTDSKADIEGGLSTLRALVTGREAGNGTRTVLVLLSDFLTGSADTERNLAELALPRAASLLASPPAERGEDNAAITAVEPLRPILIAVPRAGEGAAERTPVTVRVRRSGPGVASPRVTGVRVRISGAEEAQGPPGGQATIRWGAGESEAQVSVDLAAPSTAAGTLVLSAAIDDDAIAGDNTWRRTLEVRPSLRVGLVSPRRLGPGGARPGVAEFEPADWIRVALDPWFGDRISAGAPRPTRDIDVVEIEPASVDPARLSGLAAVIVARPDAVGEPAWRHLRHLADTGGLVVVFPPAQATVHLWADAMVREFALDWTVAREAKVHPEPVKIATEDRPGDAEDRGLLAMVAHELDGLAAPVWVERSLPVEAPPSGPSATLLKLTDGSALLIASPPGRDAPGPNGGSPPAAAAETEGRSRGMVALIGVAPTIQWTNLQACPLMVPLLHELVVQGVARSRGDWAAIAGTRPETPARTAELRPIGEGPAIAVDRTGRAAEPLRYAGLWRAMDDRGVPRGLVPVNADADAGRTDPQPASAIQAWLAEAAAGAGVQWLNEPGTPSPAEGAGPTLRDRLDRGNDAAPWSVALLIAALAVALLELAMARWFSHATLADSGAAAGVGGSVP